jgi:hypothetical protein
VTRLALAFATAMLTAVAGCGHASAPSGKAIPAPEASKAHYKNVPPYQLENARLSGDMPRLTDNVKLRYAMAGKNEAVGMYKICVGPTGDVTQVYTIAGVGDGDDAVTATLQTWKFKPQPTGICSMSRFIWAVRWTPRH